MKRCIVLPDYMLLYDDNDANNKSPHEDFA